MNLGSRPIRDYAAVGDGRCVALVASDGTIDWWCVPDIDSPSVFGALLDARAGRFELAPAVPYRVERGYVPGTNVLQTTFHTEAGTVRVTDALTLPSSGLGPMRELVRTVEGVSGRVRLDWRVEPRFGYAAWTTTWHQGTGALVASGGASAIGLCSWGAGDPSVAAGAATGSFEVDEGASALMALAVAQAEPVVIAPRHDIERRVVDTIAFWQDWSDSRRYDGPWQDAVLRSALALKLLVYAPSGALAAAATTSLPESVGGERNWDYRFCWVRDSAFFLEALLAVGCGREADAFFWWLMQASQLTSPQLQVLYRLDGGARAPEQNLALCGYAESTPVRIGNGAVDQLQLDIYGDLLQTVSSYASAGRAIDRELGRRLAATADLVCAGWLERDAGLWEVRAERQHFTQSKMMCWIALDRAIRLASAGLLPARHREHWEHERAAIAEFIEHRCWSESQSSYTRAADLEDVDAGVLLGILFGYPGTEDRLARTVDAIERSLRKGPFVYRYVGDDGLPGSEGAFLACSFWLAEALACTGRQDAAVALMDELVGTANDVGLYAEEVDMASGAFLGNFPQALTHLALIRAAVRIGS